MTQFLYNPPGVGQFCHCADLLLHTNGNLYVCWYAYPEKEYENGKIIFVSYDMNTKNWSTPKIIFPEVQSSQGNAILFEYNQSIGIIFTSLTGKYWNSGILMFSQSSNDGLNWTAPTQLLDKPGIIVRHPPLFLDNDCALLPLYDEDKKQSMIFKFYPKLQSLRPFYHFDQPNLIQPALISKNKRNITAIFRPAGDSKKIWISHSENEGLSWTTPHPTQLPCSMSGNDVFTFKNGMGIVYNHTTGHQRYPMSISTTTDNGKNWSNTWNFDTVELELSYPSFTTDNKGVVHGVYTYNRKMIKYVHFTAQEITNAQSSSSERAIQSYKNLHQGKRLFILASGPSLSDHNLSLLDRRITMGLNRSFLIYPSTYYHCVMDERLFEIYPKELKQCRVLFTLTGRPWGHPLNLLGSEGFSFDLDKGIYSGYTVSFFALQVAIYLGFQEIYYLGLDLKHKAGNTHFFGHDYHSKNHEKTEFPKMIKMLNYAAKEIANTGVQVYNCSPVSDLTCFPKISFEEAIKK